MLAIIIIIVSLIHSFCDCVCQEPHQFWGSLVTVTVPGLTYGGRAGCHEHDTVQPGHACGRLSKGSEAAGGEGPGARQSLGQCRGASPQG